MRFGTARQIASVHDGALHAAPSPSSSSTRSGGRPASASDGCGHAADCTDDAGALAIYAKVLAGRIRFPSHFAPDARDLVRRLLTADRTLRLGCMRAGVADITAHAWFAGVSWEAAAARMLPPPFVPPLRGAADTSNFDKYPESDDEPAKADAPPRDAAREAADAALFASFDDL